MRKATLALAHAAIVYMNSRVEKDKEDGRGRIYGRGRADGMAR